MPDPLPGEFVAAEFPAHPVPLRIRNEWGVLTAVFQCQSCGGLFCVIPAPDIDQYDEWIGCLDESCSSYEPMRDASLYFGLGMVKRDDEGATDV